MDKQSAFQILVEVTGQVNASREVHVRIQQALDVIRQAIAEPDVAKEEKK